MTASRRSEWLGLAALVLAGVVVAALLAGWSGRAPWVVAVAVAAAGCGVAAFRLAGRE